ncbi:hypothetical protein ACA910_022513 [Epithemia clementina (nom. ined.)]
MRLLATSFSEPSIRSLWQTTKTARLATATAVKERLADVKASRPFSTSVKPDWSSCIMETYQVSFPKQQAKRQDRHQDPKIPARKASKSMSDHSDILHYGKGHEQWTFFQGKDTLHHLGQHEMQGKNDAARPFSTSVKPDWSSSIMESYQDSFPKQQAKRQHRRQDPKDPANKATKFISYHSDTLHHGEGHKEWTVFQGKIPAPHQPEHEEEGNSAASSTK